MDVAERNFMMAERRSEGATTAEVAAEFQFSSVSYAAQLISKGQRIKKYWLWYLGAWEALNEASTSALDTHLIFMGVTDRGYRLLTDAGCVTMRDALTHKEYLIEKAKSSSQWKIVTDLGPIFVDCQLACDGEEQPLLQRRSFAVPPDYIRNHPSIVSRYKWVQSGPLVG